MNPLTADRRHLDDLALGETVRLGSVTVTRDMIVAFAREFDPFPFHLDEEAAKNSLLGGLAASGFHTVALTMRLLTDAFLGRIALLAGLSVADLRWKRPVMVGDVLSGSATISGLRPSKSDAGRGVLTLAIAISNQRGESVMTMTATSLVARRVPAAEAAP
jgi:acyl dehydratase